MRSENVVYIKRKIWRKRQNKEYLESDIFLVSVFGVYLTNFTNKVVCKLKKYQLNLAWKSDTAT